ncbi:MAG TPA: ferric reductase-like transmembrane domain-containing protein [Microlunatus sp.]
MRDRTRTVRWLLVYVLLAVAPLLLSLIQLDPGRGFWVNVSVGAGFVGLSLMGLQFVLAARSVRINRPFGADVLLQFHRQITVLIAVLIFAHPIILMFWDSRFLALLNIVESPVRAKLAVLSVVFLLVLIATSVWRRKLRLRYPVWQLLHAVLAVLIVVTGLAHVLLIGYYVDQPWERALWIAYSGAFLWIGFWVRVLVPIRRWRRRWRVVAVREQPQHSHTVTLQLVDPSSYGPDGFRFQPGQFAWIHTGRSPFALDYHPFSISSSAEAADQLEFTIKTEHGFTTTIHDLEPGRIVYLDGPWGHFSYARHEAPGYVFLAAGVGVTPMLSMISTLADRADSRPCWLILGNRHEHEIIGGADLEALTERHNVTVVHVISAPGPDWTGRRGRANAEVLDEVLPENRNELEYFICGPDPMMDAAEEALRNLGIPRKAVHAERFGMV